jgi:hypothetical protein
MLIAPLRIVRTVTDTRSARVGLLRLLPVLAGDGERPCVRRLRQQHNEPPNDLILTRQHPATKPDATNNPPSLTSIGGQTRMSQIGPDLTVTNGRAI